MDVGLRNARLNFRQVEPFYVEQGCTPVGELIRFQNFREPSCRRNAAFRGCASGAREYKSTDCFYFPA